MSDSLERRLTELPLLSQHADAFRSGWEARQVKTLGEMTAEVTEWCHDKGWYDTPVSFLEAMALLTTEVSEACEEYREGRDQTAVRGATRIWWKPWKRRRGKLNGVGAEFADVLIRLLDDCGRYGYDLEVEYERKMAWNRKRAYRHGGKRA